MGTVGNCSCAVLGLCMWVIASCSSVASLQVEGQSNLQEHAEHSEQLQDESMLGRLQRKLLAEDEGDSRNLNVSNPRMSEDIAGSSPWPILVGLMLAVLSVAFVTMLVVKYRLIQRFFGGYSEALLPEGDTASQFSHAGTITAHGMREREVYTIGHEEDDDGFIEDNYISSGEKERVATETEEEVMEDDSDDELDIHFSIE